MSDRVDTVSTSQSVTAVILLRELWGCESTPTVADEGCVTDDRRWLRPPITPRQFAEPHLHSCCTCTHTHTTTISNQIRRQVVSQGSVSTYQSGAADSSAANSRQCLITLLLLLLQATDGKLLFSNQGRWNSLSLFRKVHPRVGNSDPKPGRLCVIRGKVIHLHCIRVASSQEICSLGDWPSALCTPSGACHKRKIRCCC